MKKTGSRNLYLAVLAAVIVIVGALIFAIYDKANYSEYRNESLGISFMYPEDWVIAESSDLDNGLVLTLETADTQELIENKEIPPGYTHNLSIYLYDDINNQYAQGGSSSKSRYDYTDIEEFLDDDVMKMMNKTSEIIVNGETAYEVTVGGIGQSYGVFIKKDQLYLLVFERSWDKDALGDGEGKILDTLKISD